MGPADLGAVLRRSISSLRVPLLDLSADVIWPSLLSPSGMRTFSFGLMLDAESPSLPVTGDGVGEVFKNGSTVLIGFKGGNDVLRWAVPSAECDRGGKSGIEALLAWPEMYMEESSDSFCGTGMLVRWKGTGYWY